MQNRKFYVTNPIFYPNGELHIGHTYTATVCDILARMAKLSGRETYFLLGADENSLKIQQKADEAGLGIIDFLDFQAKNAQLLFGELDISYDQYIRTTNKERHHPGVIALWNKLVEKGDIYEGYYEGYYCIGCESFKTEKDLVDGLCPDHGTKPDFIKEKNYFFKLTKYADQVKKLLETNTIAIFPESRKNEALNIIKEDITDLSFSRPNKGQVNVIPVPGDDTQGVYVWGDALVNYISALGYGSLGQDLPESLYNIFWNNTDSQKVHVIGKDILKFHAFIWPAMLLAAEVPLPNQLVVHGLMQSGGRKMSKSIGNVIDPKEMLRKIGPEGLRFYFANNIPIFDDGEITEDLIISNYNSYLSNGLGNLTNRLIKMMISYDVSVNFDNIDQTDLYVKLTENLDKILGNMNSDMAFNINIYTSYLWQELSRIDVDIQAKEPFKLFKTNPDEARKIVEDMLVRFYTIIHFIQPILPKTVSSIIQHIQDRQMPEKPLFPKVEMEK
ncbi:methionine--tRNA ligase [Candidatus Parcubacteria bacterium]|nr:methionine--tRNA ligase [Candidatus Parcubacteria bacterium]